MINTIIESLLEVYLNPFQRLEVDIFEQRNLSRNIRKSYHYHDYTICIEYKKHEVWVLKEDNIIKILSMNKISLLITGLCSVLDDMVIDYNKKAATTIATHGLHQVSSFKNTNN